MADIDKDKIRIHYEIEKELAQRILNAPYQERSKVAREAYSELFRSVPWHPQLLQKSEDRKRLMDRKIDTFLPLIRAGSNVLEIGCGDAQLGVAIVGKGCKYLGIDIAPEMIELADSHVPVRQMDAVHLELESEQFDIVVSSQLLEHLHPDDVHIHLSEVQRVLVKGGVYLFDTPNSVTGPHDVSKYFDKVATGFHLKEWNYSDLSVALKESGFTRIKGQLLPPIALSKLQGSTRWGLCPICVKEVEERIVALLPCKYRIITGKLLAVTNMFLHAQRM